MRRDRDSPTSDNFHSNLISPRHVPVHLTSPLTVPNVGHLKLPAASENLGCFSPPASSPRTVWASQAEEALLAFRTDSKSAFHSALPCQAPVAAQHLSHYSGLQRTLQMSRLRFCRSSLGQCGSRAAPSGSHQSVLFKIHW